MTLKDLVEKLEREGRFSCKRWAEDLNYCCIEIVREKMYCKIYGFLWGLYSAGYLANEYHTNLTNEILGMLYNRNNGGQP